MWRGFFPLAPASVCLTLMEIESSFRPDAHAPVSGAWGLLQLLPSTAGDMAIRVRRRISLVRDIAVPAGVVNPTDTLALWDVERPECLSNPALGSLLGVAYLDHLAEMFGPRLELLAAAYHNGPGFLRGFRAAGRKLPEDLPPKGKAYVQRALSLWPKYEADDETPTPPRGIPAA
jgi:soluble lytic murein transglycosylase-like protein